MVFMYFLKTVCKYLTHWISMVCKNHIRKNIVKNAKTRYNTQYKNNKNLIVNTISKCFILINI